MKYIFPELKVLSTKVDNICGTKAIRGKICLNNLFKSLVESNSKQFKVRRNSQMFPGLFVKFCGHQDSKHHSVPLTGT